MEKIEKLKAYEEKAKKASELFRDIRSGKYRREAIRNPRIRLVSLHRLRNSEQGTIQLTLTRPESSSEN